MFFYYLFLKFSKLIRNNFAKMADELGNVSLATPKRGSYNLELLEWVCALREARNSPKPTQPAPAPPRAAFLSGCLPLLSYFKMLESVGGWGREVTHEPHLKRSPLERLGHPGVSHSPWGSDKHLLASLPQMFMFLDLQRFLMRWC